MTSKLSLELATREEALVWTETVLFAFTNVVAVFGNLLTFYAVYRNHMLRTVTNMFVIALAISDILMCTCCMPFTVVTVPRPVDIWRNFLSPSRFCRADSRDGLHSYHGCHCRQPILLRCKTRKVSLCV